MSEIIPCHQNADLRLQIEQFAETLKTEAHRLGNHGLEESDFYNSGLFRGAIERVRGQFSAATRGKKEFVQHVLNFMEDEGFIKSWELAGNKNRHDYVVILNSGRVAVIELKGCLDGNNTIIYDRPSHAEEFVLWSICTNRGADPRHNVWSGIHTRLSADIIERDQRVDGLIVWDMLCGTIGRPCPKLTSSPERFSLVGPYKLPPACLYVFPSTIASLRNNPRTTAQALRSVEILHAFHQCFKGSDAEVNYVDFEVEQKGPDLLRTTRVRRGSAIVKQSAPTPIQRS